MKYLVLLFLVSCQSPKITPQLHPVREPFEYVLVGNKSIEDQEFLDRAYEKCKGTISITKVESYDELTVMYFICKVGR